MCLTRVLSPRGESAVVAGGGALIEFPSKPLFGGRPTDVGGMFVQFDMNMTKTCLSTLLAEKLTYPSRLRKSLTLSSMGGTLDVPPLLFVSSAELEGRGSGGTGGQEEKKTRGGQEGRRPLPSRSHANGSSFSRNVMVK